MLRTLNEGWAPALARAMTVAGVLSTLGACDQKPVTTPAVVSAAAASASAVGVAVPAASTATLPMPDVGKLEMVKITADGSGASASDAVGEAMRLAILQVNGASIDMASVNSKLGIDVTLNQSAASLRAVGFSDSVRQRSGGVIQNFRIVDLSEPLLPKGRYKVTIEASIAKFSAPAELKKIKLVVAPLRFDRTTIAMGDRNVPSAEVGAELRQRILDALVNTGRFAVLDREFSPDIQQELDLIASGESPRAEVAKLSQAVSADLIWSGRVNALAYNRHARQLQTSDRELVSYSGGWSVSQKLVNVATRQVMNSQTLQGQAPSTAATTLGSGVDSRKVLDGMTNDLVNQVVASILSRTFPITVVSLDGANVVLSQGGQALRSGARYAMVTMGAEMKDPQTGQSLGRVESPCCELVIDRVTPNLSYGHIENARGSMDQMLPGALQVREALKTGAKSLAVATSTGNAVAGEKPAAAEHARKSPRVVKAEATEPSVPAARKNDDKW